MIKQPFVTSVIGLCSFFINGDENYFSNLFATKQISPPQPTEFNETKNKKRKNDKIESSSKKIKSESEQSDILVKKKNLENLLSKKNKQITNDKL